MEKEVNKKEVEEVVVEEEQPLTTLTERSAPRPVVAWELCSSESLGQPGVSETQYKTQLTGSGDKASIKGDDARGGDLSRTADVERLHMEDGQQKDDRIQRLHTDGRGEMQENGGCVDNRSLNSNDDTGAEEPATRGDRQKMDKTSIKGKTTEGEHDTMFHRDKADLENEDCDTHLCLRQEEKNGEKKWLQRNAAVEPPASEKEGSEQVTNQLFVIKKSADDKMHHKNGNLPGAQAVSLGKPDNAAILTDMQSNDDKTERNDVMSNDNAEVLTPSHWTVSNPFMNDIQAEKGKHSSEIKDEESNKETSPTSNWVTVNTVNNVGQETSGEIFKTILRGICEGQQVVSPGLNPPSEEAQGGFPERNNKQKQDENTTQKFLEERDPKEHQNVLFPEEMGAKQSMQNNCSSTGCGNLLLTGSMEEEQKPKDNIKEDSNLTPGLLNFSHNKSLQVKEPPLVESGKQEILIDNVRIENKHLEEENEATSKKLRGGADVFLAEIHINDACEVHTCEVDQETQEVFMFSDKSVKFFDKKQEMADMSSRSPSLLQDSSESGLPSLKAGTEPTCLEGNTAEMQNVRLNLEESGFKDEKIVSKELKINKRDKSKSKNEKHCLNLAVASLSEPNTDSGDNLVVESEAQQSKAISNDTVSKSTAKDMTAILAEETERLKRIIYTEKTSLNSTPEVIDEETSEPWIQTFWSQDTDGVRWQEQLEPGQQVGWKIEPLNNEGGEGSDLTESKDQCAKPSQSGGSEFRSDAGMSSCTKQSTFWDDAHWELGAPKGESSILNLTGTLGTTSDMLESDVSKIFIPGSTTESLGILMEDISKIHQSHLRETGHFNQEMVESQGNFSEESGSQSDVEITHHTGPAFVQVTNDTLAISGDKVDDGGSAPSRSSAEENVSTECASQGDTGSSCSLKLSLMGTPQVALSEDYVDALPGLNRTQVTTYLTKGSRNQMEVLFHNLYISEKSF